MSSDSVRRLFLGIPLPDFVEKSLLGWQETQPRLPGIKWVRHDQWHLTVYFFGGVEEEMMGNLESLIQLALREQKSFELSFQGWATAPPRKEPRMLWARYQRHPEFDGMVAKLRGLYQQIQPDLPSRFKPIPHVTLARLKTPDLAREITWPEKSLPNFQVKEVVLWESELTPEGPEYQIARRYRLR
ncbi:MAG: RNA 2',3'-cyclic phosphodiesterase [Bacteroidota bacterium]